MSVTTNPLLTVAKKQVDRDWIQSPAFNPTTIRNKFGITETEVYKQLEIGEETQKFLKEINHIPSLLKLKTIKGTNGLHSVLVIPRNAEGRVGSYDFWKKESDSTHTWYENIFTHQSSWVAPKGKIYEKIGKKWVSSTGEEKDFVSSVEIFEPNGMSFRAIDEFYGTNFVEIKKFFTDNGIEVIRNTKTIQGSSVLKSHGQDYDARGLIVNAPICFKHTIVRWLKQNQTLPEYQKFVESEDYYSADDKVADIFNGIETYSIYAVEEHEGPEGKKEHVARKTIRENRVLFANIQQKLRELEEEGKAKVPFEIEIRKMLDVYAKDKTHSASQIKVLEDRFKALLERRDELKGENFFELVDRYRKVLPADKIEKITNLVTNPYNPTWLVKDEGLTSKIKNTLRQAVAKEEGKVIANEPVEHIQPFGISTATETLKKGGMIHGKKDQAVPIIAHEGELVVPKKVVPNILHSSAWKNHIEEIARSKKLTFAQAKQYALGNRMIVKKVKPKKKSYWSDTSESDW
jgi:hypothetical protein